MLRPSHRLVVGSLLAICTTGSTALLAAPAAHAATSATVRVSGSLKMRAAPTTHSAVAGSLRNGARVSIACQVSGQYVRGSMWATAQWDRLTNGRYISHAYVRETAWIPPCGASAAAPAAAATAAASTPATGAVAGTVRSNHGPVRFRAGASSSVATLGSLRNGTRITIACAVTGQYVRGTAGATAQWDRLTNGSYISHAYVASGAVPRCDAPPAPIAPPATAIAAGPVGTMSNAQFIAASVPGAQQGWREFGVPPSVTIAQGILESGWGRSTLSTNDRNYVGIKCFGSPGAIAVGCRSYPTTECDRAGNCFPTTATFRSYAAVGDSYRDHGYFLRTNSRYASAFTYTRDANTQLLNGNPSSISGAVTTAAGTLTMTGGSNDGVNLVGTFGGVAVNQAATVAAGAYTSAGAYQTALQTAVDNALTTDGATAGAVEARVTDVGGGVWKTELASSKTAGAATFATTGTAAAGVTAGASSANSAYSGTFQIGANNGPGDSMSITFNGVSASSLSLSTTGVSSTASAQAAITTLDTAIGTVSTTRAKLGAYQNRFEQTINNLSVAVENLSASESRIRDTDMAQEMVQFTRSQILSQAGTAMLAQANQAPQSVLSLLR